MDGDNEKEVEQKREKDEVKKIIKSIVVSSGIVIVGSVVGGYLGGHIRKREREKLLYNNSIKTFQRTINWFDEKFDHLKLRELWETYAKEHPENVVYTKN